VLPNRRSTILGLGPILASFLVCSVLLATVSAQSPSAGAAFPMEGSATTEDGRTFALQGIFEIAAADRTADSIILIGNFSGSISGSDETTAELTDYWLVAPILSAGPGDRCELLSLESANLFIDALRRKPSTSAVLHLESDAGSDELLAGLCQLARVFDEDIAGSVDGLVFRVNELLLEQS
jgi:hypothetical protein